MAPKAQEPPKSKGRGKTPTKARTRRSEPHAADDGALGGQNVVKMARKRRRTGKRGQPDLFTPETRQTILQAIRAGAPREMAASYAGIGRATLYRWLERGRRRAFEVDQMLSAGHSVPASDDDEYRDFWDAVEQSDGVVGVAMVTQIRQAATTAQKDNGLPDWEVRTKNAKWWLERRAHGFQPKELIGVAGIPGEEPIQVEVSAADRDERRRQMIEIWHSAGVAEALERQREIQLTEGRSDEAGQEGG